MRKHIQEECTNTRCMNATIDCIILVMNLKLNNTRQRKPMSASRERTTSSTHNLGNIGTRRQVMTTGKLKRTKNLRFFALFSSTIKFNHNYLSKTSFLDIHSID